MFQRKKLRIQHFIKTLMPKIPEHAWSLLHGKIFIIFLASFFGGGVFLASFGLLAVVRAAGPVFDSWNQPRSLTSEIYSLLIISVVSHADVPLWSSDVPATLGVWWSSSTFQLRLLSRYSCRFVCIQCVWWCVFVSEQILQLYLDERSKKNRFHMHLLHFRPPPF